MKCEHCPRHFLGPGAVVLSGLIGHGDCRNCILNQIATLESLNKAGLGRRDASVEEIHAVLKEQLIQPGYRLRIKSQD